MNLKTPRKAPFLIAAGVIGLVCLVQVFRFDFFERLERMTYDLRVRRAANHSSLMTTNLGFVAISEETIRRINNGSLGFSYGLYWPRHIYGRVARELHSQGATASAFDVLFGELRHDHAPVPMANGQLVESDEYFAWQIHAAGNVILASEKGVVPPRLFRTNALWLGDITATKDSDGILRRARAFRTYRRWHRCFQAVEDDPDYGIDLSKARMEPGMIILPRSNGEVVKVPLNKEGKFDVADFLGAKIPAGMARFDNPFTEEQIWHMGIVLAAQQLKLDLEHAKIELEKGRIILSGDNGIERILPVDSDGYFYINWCLTGNDPQLTSEPMENLLRQDQLRQTGQTNGLRNLWKGKLVVIGSTAVGNDLMDRGATPLEEDTILACEHWNVANSVVSGQFVHRSSLFMNLVLICLMGLCAAYLTWKFRPHIASFWILVAFVAYGLFAFACYGMFHFWIPVVMPLAGGLLATYAVMLAYLVMFEQAERRRVRSVFSKVVSPNIVNELLKSEKLALSGARRSVTVLFSDIRGFTEITDLYSERAVEFIKQNNLSGEAAETIFDEQAREILSTVNLYLKVIADVVLKHQGTIDKFIGDCVMAFWGAPVINQKHALCGVRAAIEIQRAVDHLNHDRELENERRKTENYKLSAANQPLLPMLPILSVGTGINTGVVTVGLMGTNEQFNYTVFGRDVNLAQRLESVSGKGRIIISEATLAEIIQDDPNLALACMELPAVNVKGIRNAVPIFEVPWMTREGEAAETNYSNVEAGGAQTAYLAPTDKEGD
ncbi:CHASE2 domain-containing protein [Pedosphaera parvula]|uniref:CHASE2 domain-containing protein n=1 Tax=Pedosphaera parvula TaxID=1032527 RepID=UPI00135F1168|nr:adenylate/guanylate cyclase domain-containing protein [Pedosphaera parvula]